MSDIRQFVKERKCLFRLWAVIILVASVIAAGGTYAVMSHKQTYSASVNLKFLNSSAKDGYAFDGTKISDDIEEFSGADVISSGILEANLQNTTTANEITPLLKIEAVIPKEEQDRIDSALDNGKEYEYNPIEYKIVLTTPYPETGRLLSSIAHAFELNFAKTHSGLSEMPSSMDADYRESLDFIETAELFDSHISKMMDYADNLSSSLPQFRSSSTGYSYADLATEYQRMSEEDLAGLYAKILAEKASKNPELLRQKLQADLASSKAENKDYADSLKSLEELIASYSEKNKSTGVVSDGFGDRPIDENRTNIMEGVYENEANPQSAYDSLFSAYNRENDAVSLNNIDSDFNRYLLEVFQETSSSADEKTAGEIQGMIADIMTQENEYYKIAQRMKSESDEIIASSMIQQMNTPVAQPAIRVRLYSMIAFAAAFLLMCVLLPAGYMLRRNIVEHIRGAGL